MNFISSILPFIIMGGMAFFYFWMMKKRKSGLQNLTPAIKRFFEETGYRYINIKDAPIEEHVKINQEMMNKMMTGKGHQETTFIRNFHGIDIYNQTYNGSSSSAGVMMCKWFIELDIQPGVLWHIADKTLSSPGKVMKETFTNIRQNWKPLFSQKIKINDPDLNKRFVVYGENPESVQNVMANPLLKELLLDFKVVDLSISKESAVFSDPLQKNVMAGIGGTVGLMSMGYDYGKMFDLSIPVHNSIAELLITAIRVSSR